MAGLLINQKVDKDDFISLIPYWRYLGYIEFEEFHRKDKTMKSEIVFRKLKELPVDAPKYQKILFYGIFRANVDIAYLSIIRNHFNSIIALAEDDLKEAAQIYFDGKSNRLKKQINRILNLFLYFGSILFLIFWGGYAFLSMVVTSKLLLVLNRFILKRNSAGSKVKAELIGYKKFIESVDEDKLELLLKQDPLYHEKTLSYAVAFGLLKKWGERFEGVDKNLPILELSRL